MKNKKTSDTVLLINTASEVVLFALYILQGFAEQSIRQVAEQSKTEPAFTGRSLRSQDKKSINLSILLLQMMKYYGKV